MINFIDETGKQHSAIVECKKTKGVNGEKSLTGTIYTNNEILEGIGRGWRLQFEDENYCLTYVNPIDEGTRIVVEFDAVHEFFFDLSKSVVYTELNGSNTANAYLDFIFNGSGYSYRLEVTIPAFEKENFGMKNRLSLFNDFITSTGVEFSVNGKIVRILEKVGSNLSTIVKKGFNLNELKIEKDAGSFITYIKGFGAYKDPNDHSKGRLEVEYLSPLADIYGKLEGDPVIDERYTKSDSLLNRLKNEVESSYGISVNIDMEDLTKAGYEYDQPHEGDYIMAINKDLRFEQKVRIMSYTTSYDTEGNILDHEVSCGSDNIIKQSAKSESNFRKNVQAGLENAVNTANQAWISADGKNKVFTGTDKPVATNKGDIWYQIDGEKTIMKFWNGYEWVEFMDPKAVQDAAANAAGLANQAAKEAADALDTANDAVDQATQASQKADNSAELADEAKSQAATAENNANTALTNAKQAVNEVTGLQKVVTTNSADIDKLEDAIVLKADTTTVNAVTGRVDSAEGKITTMAGQIELKASKASVDTLTNRVSSTESTLTTQAGAISALNSLTDGHTTQIGNLKSSYEGMSSTIATVQQDLDKKATITQFSDLSQTVNSLQGTVANKAEQSQVTQLAGQITNVVSRFTDGNNLVSDGDFESGINRGLELVKKTDTYPVPSGNWMAKIQRNDVVKDGDYFDFLTLEYGVPLLANVKYTIEYDYSIAGSVAYASDYAVDSNGNYVYGMMMEHDGHILDGGQTVWKKFTKTFTLSKDTIISKLRFGFTGNYSGVGWKTIDNIKIYQGESVSSQITQLADRMNFRITNSDGSITQIDLANKVISLSGEQVNITGNTYIANGVIKTANIADAAITNAKIGSISADKINVGTLNAANVNIINLNASNITSGTISGTNLSINLATGVVNFQKGSITSTNGTLDIQIATGTMGVYNTSGDGVTFSNGYVYLTKKYSGMEYYGSIKYAENLFSYNNKGISIVGNQGITLKTSSFKDSAFYPFTRFTGAGISATESDSDNNSRMLIASKDIVSIYGGTLINPNMSNPARILVGVNSNASPNISGNGILIEGGNDGIHLRGPVSGEIVPSSNESIYDMKFVWKVGGTSYAELTTYSGAWGITAWSSDRNLKKNISTQNDSALSVVDQLKIKQFDWKEGGKHVDFGLIAQEVETVLPDAVFSVMQPNGEQRRQLKSEAFVPLLLKSIQELKQEIETLKAKAA